MASPSTVVKNVGPKMIPFFASVSLFFYLYPNDAYPSAFCMLVKCSPIISLCLFIIQNGFSFQFRYLYSRRILIGLIFSMIGDACLVFDKEYFLFGLISFAIAHIFYFTAFGIKPFNFRLAFAIVGLSVPITALYVPFIGDFVLKLLVPLYTLLLLSMLWRALSRMQLFEKKDSWTWTRLCCSIGAFFFVLSDSVLSFNYFIYPVPYSHPIIMFTYYAAQFGITLSVVDSGDSNEVNRMVIQHKDLINGLKRVYLYLKTAYFDDNLEFVGLTNAKSMGINKRLTNEQKID